MLFLIKLKFHDPENPSLGLLLRILTFCGLWHPELKSLKSRLKLFFFYTLVAFFISLYVKFALNFSQESLKDLLKNTPFHLGVIKILFFQKDYKSWVELIGIISNVERKQFIENDAEQQKVIKNYLSSSRRVVYFFFTVALVADLFIYNEPYMRNQRNNGTFYYYIFETYSPFPRQPPWYYCTMVFQQLFAWSISLNIICWDMMTITIMIYLAGQLRISCLYCSNVMDVRSGENSQRKIAECHRFHRSVVMTFTKFNSLISPVMFMYVVIVSVNLGACIIEIALEDDLTTILTDSIYTSALLIQLLLFYWHSNEVTVESERVSYNTFRSEWVDVDFRLQRQLLLLSWTTSKRLAFTAGPFNKMTLSTFISILRGTYSFYTLLNETS